VGFHPQPVHSVECRLGKNTKQIIVFGQGRLNTLPTSGHSKALQILPDAIKRYRKIIKNLESVPVTSISTAWEAHQVKERAAKIKALTQK
jgi:hypothetical protein